MAPSMTYCINGANWKLARKMFKELTKTAKPDKLKK